MAGNITVATAAIADVTDKQSRTKGMALVGAAFALGFMTGPAIGGLSTKINLLDLAPSLASIGVHPFSTPALVACILAIINLIWVIKKFPETLPKEKRLKKKESFLGDMAKNVSRWPIHMTNLSYFIFILSFSGLEFTLVFLATERFGYGPVENGYLFLYIGVILMITYGILARRLSSVVGERPLAIIAMLAGMIAFSMIGVATTKTLFYWGCLFLALSIALASASLSSLVSLYATQTTQGRYLGLHRSAGALARAVGPILIAIVYFYLGAQSAYISGTFALIVPITLIFILPKPDKRPSVKGVKGEPKNSLPRLEPTPKIER